MIKRGSKGSYGGEAKKPLIYAGLAQFYAIISETPVRPHDLRRHAATYASRSGMPIEIVSKVILRHSNLSTTERYLGKISDIEAMKWIDTLYA